MIPLDFKLSCMMWKLASSSTHQARLVDILELTLATVVVNKELCGQLARLRQMLVSGL